MPRYRLKFKEIIAIDTPGDGLIFETPDGVKFDQYAGAWFEALFEEIKPATEGEDARRSGQEV